ncbi:DNA-binding GntR family transcriptional regulator OS=Castellaniella defragrans OX=75697 GN=HNR28_001954 PE=4 SV=1 [Castellaniella defragrans]
MTMNQLDTMTHSGGDGPSADTDSFDSPQKDRAPLADQAYDAIIDLILSYQLRLGERTSVSQLADRLSLGRTPVKEAIARLESEGLLSVAGRSGTTVNDIDARTARQLFALRRVLENFAVDEAVLNVTDEDLRRIEGLLTELTWPQSESASLRRDLARYVRSNVRFHAAIVGCARNPTLDRLYAQVQLQAQIVVYLYRMGSDSTDRAVSNKYREHAAIYEALRERDARKLKTLLENHAESTETMVLGLL